jgi:hypothetical protein
MSKNVAEACEFVRSTRVEERLRVQPASGYTSAQIFELLNAGRLQVVGESLLLAQESGDCSEGQSVVGTVLANETFQHPRPWRKLGATKSKRRQERRDNKPTAPPRQSPKQALNPSAVPSPDFLVSQASRLRLGAERLLQTAQPDVSAAKTALEAARKLLQSANDMGSYEAATLESVWLLAAEGLLADKSGDVEQARALLYMAGLNAALNLGVGHPSTIVLHGNHAQYQIEHGEVSGKADLLNAIERLEKTTPSDNCTQEWLDRTKAEFRATLAQADELIAAYKSATQAAPAADVDAMCDVVPDSDTDCCDVVRQPAVSATPRRPAGLTPIKLTGATDPVDAVRSSSRNVQPSQLISTGTSVEKLPRPIIVRKPCVRDPNWKRPAGSVWLDSNRHQLPPREWSACTGNGVVAHDKDYDGLVRKLTQIGVDTASVVVTFNESFSSGG